MTAAEPRETEPKDAAAGPDEEGGGGTRYDELADGYERHWAPVLRGAAVRVLDHLEPVLAERPRAEVLDIGTGTGTLAIAALERWPRIRLTGIDPSGGMLEVAGQAAAERLPVEARRRFTRRAAPAERLPFEDGAFDAAVSSFVLQLVPSRSAALREARRVLRPGGLMAWVAWQRADRPFEPDRIANEVLDDHGFDPPEPDSRPGDIASPRSAAESMRRAGFRDVRAWTDECVHAWDARGYLGFLTEFDEQSLFDELDRDERAEIEAKILRRLERLGPDELTLRLPVVYVVGRAPG